MSGYILNPFTGKFDWKGPSPTDSAQFLLITRIATIDTSALKLIKADSPTHVSVGTSDSTYEDAQILGISLTSALAGNTINILLTGALSDGTFGFGLNVPLYLGTSGAITATAPLTGHLVNVAKSLGSGEIFIEISEVTVLI